MLSTSLKRRLVRILPIGFIWLVAAATFLLIEWSAAGGQFVASDTTIVPDAGILVFALSAMFALGLLVGYLELYVLNRLFSRTTFLRKLIGKFFLYLLFVHVVAFVSFPLAAAMESDTHPLDPAVWEKLQRYLRSLTHFNTVLQLAIIIVITLVYVQVSEVIGHTTLLNHLSGRYHHPREEERIYLFLDMRSSTTIAERLGHEEYFNLLQSYYADLSEAVNRHAGEIYLYVGDEMIVNWKMADGLTKNNCLRCFFAMRDDLQRRRDWYLKRYGLLPKFKAGLHYGMVTTGEIGVQKKHIMFTGDVLNATARIQALCNEEEVELLVSAPLIERLPLAPPFRARSLGHRELRGRSETLELFTVSCPSPAGVGKETRLLS